MTYLGQHIQIDMKHVPSSCLTGELASSKFYQYTAIDEFSRYRFIEAFEEVSIYFFRSYPKSVSFPERVRANRQ